MTGRTRINEDNIFPRLVAGSLITSGVVGAATALLVSPRFGISLLAGGVLATANFVWLRRGLEASLRLAIMALLLYLVIVRLGADIFGLLLGLSVLVINITIFSIYLSTRKGG